MFDCENVGGHYHKVCHVFSHRADGSILAGSIIHYYTTTPPPNTLQHPPSQSRRGAFESSPSSISGLLVHEMLGLLCASDKRGGGV